MTPLTWCAYAGYSEAIAEMLQDARTEPNMIVLQEDGALLTALDIALKIQERGVEVAGMLRDAGGRTFQTLQEEVDDETLQRLLPPLSREDPSSLADNSIQNEL